MKKYLETHKEIEELVYLGLYALVVLALPFILPVFIAGVVILWLYEYFKEYFCSAKD